MVARVIASIINVGNIRLQLAPFLGLFSLMHSAGIAAYSGSDIIATYAGNAKVGYAGDGGPAVLAALNQPYDAAVDSSGNLYFSDFGSNTVRKVDTSGIITTVAGTGTAGYNGDNILAVTAQVNQPRGLAFDGDDNLYIADLGNHRVRKVAAGTGLMSTFTGTGVDGCNNDTASLAVFSAPVGLAFDTGGTLYISDIGTGTVRKVSNGLVTSFVGTCSQSAFDTPNGLAVDRSGNVYVTEISSNRVWMVNSAGAKTVFAGNGAFGNAGDGNVASSSGVSLEYPFGIARDSVGDIFIGSGAVVRVVTPDGIIHTAAGSGAGGYTGDGGLATSAGIGGMSGIGGVAVDAANRLFITDPSNTPNVRITGPAAPVIVNVIGDGIAATGDSVVSADGRIDCPGTCGGNYVRGMPVILDASIGSADPLYEWSGTGCHRGNTSCTAFPQSLTPSTVTAYFSPWYIKTVLGGGLASKLHNPFALAFDTSGNLYFTETSTCQVRKRTSAGALTTVAGNGVCGNLGDGIPAAQAELDNPQGVVIDTGGNIFIQDTGNGVVRKITADGILHTFASGISTTTTSPALVIEPSGDLFVLDTTKDILRITPDGTPHSFLTVNSGTSNILYGLASGIAGQLILYGGYRDPNDFQFEDPAYTYISPDGALLSGFYSFETNATPAGIVVDRRGALFTEENCGVFSAYTTSTDVPIDEITSPNCGYGGDDGPAAAATLNNAIGLALDANGWIYVADTGNNAVRVLYPDAIFRDGAEQ